MDDIKGAPIICALQENDGIICPSTHECTPVAGSDQAICCPVKLSEDLSLAASEDGRPQTSKSHTKSRKQVFY